MVVVGTAVPTWRHPSKIISLWQFQINFWRLPSPNGTIVPHNCTIVETTHISNLIYIIRVDPVKVRSTVNFIQARVHAV